MTYQAIIKPKHILYVPTSNGFAPFNGAKDLVDELMDFPHILSSSTSAFTQEELLDGLSDAGLYIQEKNLVTPFQESVRLLHEQEVDYVLFVGSNDNMAEEYRRAGFIQVRRYEPHMIGKGAVVVGYLERIDSHLIKAAIEYAKKKAAEIISLNGKHMRSMAKGRTELDSYSIATLVVNGSGFPVDAIKVVGKPARRHYNSLLKNHLPVKDANVTAIFANSPLDFETPSLMGMKTISVQSHLRRTHPKADHRISGLEGIIEFLKI